MPALERGPVRPSRNIVTPELSVQRARLAHLRRPRFVEKRVGATPEAPMTSPALRKHAAMFARATGRNPELTRRASFWASQLGELRKDRKPRKADIFVAQALTSLEHQKDKAKKGEEKAHKKSERDPLTNLYNRKGIKRKFREALSRAERMNEPVSIIMGDLDHFKSINDDFGHPAGDAVLKQTARHLRKSGRGHDIWGRHGGEEFIGILPGADSKQAARAMDRQRRDLPETVDKGLIEGGKFKLNRDVTISIGVATFDRKAYEERFGTRPEQLRKILLKKRMNLSEMAHMDPKQREKILKKAEKTRRKNIFSYLTEQADQALYKAKDAGRDKVFVAASDLQGNETFTDARTMVLPTIIYDRMSA